MCETFTWAIPESGRTSSTSSSSMPPCHSFVGRTKCSKIETGRRFYNFSCTWERRLWMLESRSGKEKKIDIKFLVGRLGGKRWKGLNDVRKLLTTWTPQSNDVIREPSLFARVLHSSARFILQLCAIECNERVSPTSKSKEYFFSTLIHWPDDAWFVLLVSRLPQSTALLKKLRDSFVLFTRPRITISSYSRRKKSAPS